MANCPLPWFPIYAAEMLSDEDFLSWGPAERGCWITLSARCWADGSIPNDIDKMAKLCGCDAQAMLKHWSCIASKFAESEIPARLVSKRIEVERAASIARAEKLRQRGANGAAARWHREKTEMPEACLSNAKAMLGDATYPHPYPLKDNPLPPASAVSGDGVSEKPKRASWQKALPPDVVEATKAIKGIWPDPTKGDMQPNGKDSVPGVSSSELAARLLEIKNQGAELPICVAIANRAVREWRDGQKWIKAPQHFFGKAKDAPFRAYYQAHVTNQALRDAS